LNIDDKIVAQANLEKDKRNVRLTSLVEDYLDRYSQNGSKKTKDSGQAMLERIRKYTKNATPIPEDFDYKKPRHEHLDEKYGV
ncbi:MAG TPA: DUF6364 family protein, partial [Hanamia sp.]